MTRARLGALALLLAVVPIGMAPALAQGERGTGEVYLFLVPGVSFEELLGVPEIASLAAEGGAALMRLQGGLPTEGEPGIPPGETNVHQRWLEPGEGGLGAVADTIVETVRSAGGERVLVLVGSTTSSPAMVEAKDDLHPLVVAEGSASELFRREEEARSLTSDSTRRSGVVTDLDVTPTIAEFFGVDPPVDSTGSTIRFSSDPAPFGLHERYLAQRRMYVPVGTAAALYVTGVGLLAVAFLAGRAVVPAQWRRVAGWATFSVPMLATGLLAAGHLSVLSYATAVPMVAIVTVFGTMAFSPLERRDLTLVPAGIGLAVLAYFVLEALLGWTGMLTPLLGGSQLDGGRFYGLPNVAIGLLVGAALWLAQRVGTSRGFWLLCGLGLFAGLPLVGANLGGAVTSFAAAGLWLAVRERERLGVGKGLAAFLGVTAAGSLVILVAHAVSPVATHVTEFERDVDGLAGVIGKFVDRLQVGFDLIARSPAALVPVLGLPVALYVALRPPPSIRATFERWPAWRDAVLVTILAGLIAYVVNDSGPAAAGLAFGLGLGGMLGVSLLASAGKRGER